MRRSRIKLVVALFMLAVIVPFAVSFRTYMQVKVSNTYVNEFKQALAQVLNEGKPFDMNQVTSFDWDKMIVFQPYMSREMMERQLGMEWTTSNSYFGYWLEQSTLGSYPLDDDSMNKVVFLNEGEIVLDITYTRDEADFTQITSEVDYNDARFVIEDGNVIVKADQEEG